MSLLRLPNEALRLIAELLFSPAPQQTFEQDHSLQYPFLQHRAVVATCPALRSVFEPCFVRALHDALGHDRMVELSVVADEFKLTRVERMCLLTGGVERRPQEEIFPDEGHIVWARDPETSVDLANVHALLRVHLHGVLLLSAHGPWHPQDDEISLSISNLGAPGPPGFTTPVPIFTAPPPSVVAGEEEAPETRAWLRSADEVRARHLGTNFNSNVWGLSAFEDLYDSAPGDCVYQDDPSVLQAEVQLIHVLPASGTTGRRFEYCQLLNRTAGFRTQTDQHDDPLAGIDISGGKVTWQLSSASEFSHELDFGKPDDPCKLSGTSDDNMEYQNAHVQGSWFETNVTFESPIPLGTSQQVHTVQSVSLSIVWNGMANIQGRESLDLLPCRQSFASSAWGAWRAWRASQM